MGKTFKEIAVSVAELVEEKNKAYGDAFAKCQEFLVLLYPNGVPVEKYGDMLFMVRLFDKMMRIATNKDAFNEHPSEDILGYSLLHIKKESEKANK